MELGVKDSFTRVFQRKKLILDPLLTQKSTQNQKQILSTCIYMLPSAFTVDSGQGCCQSTGCFQGMMSDRIVTALMHTYIIYLVKGHDYREYSLRLKLCIKVNL